MQWTCQPSMKYVRRKAYTNEIVDTMKFHNAQKILKSWTKQKSDSDSDEKMYSQMENKPYVMGNKIDK